MKNYLKASGLEFSIEGQKLNYNKADFAPAVDWVKDFDFAKYAYKQSAGNDQQTSGDSKLEARSSKPNATYFGVRYMEKTEDQDLLIKNDYEYDVTAFESGTVGDEFVKTVGHYHSHLPNSKLSYPEVYEIIEGKIEYLLQSEPEEDGKVDVIWVVAETGDKIIMPPNYGHVSTNTGSSVAVESNIQKRDLPKTSDYTPFKKKVGGALYRTTEGLIENPSYQIASLRIVKPLEKPDWGLTKDKPLYTSMIENPEKFRWLTEPQKYDFDLDQLFEDVEL